VVTLPKFVSVSSIFVANDRLPCLLPFSDSRFARAKQLEGGFQGRQVILDSRLAGLGELELATCFTDLLPDRAITGGGTREIPTERKFFDLRGEDVGFMYSAPSPIC